MSKGHWYLGDSWDIARDRPHALICPFQPNIGDRIVIELYKNYDCLVINQLRSTSMRVIKFEKELENQVLDFLYGRLTFKSKGVQNAYNSRWQKNEKPKRG